jgi:hypothetical protein
MVSQTVQGGLGGLRAMKALGADDDDVLGGLTVIVLCSTLCVGLILILN